jgi:oligopeptide transport system substrate-binding protein
MLFEGLMHLESNGTLSYAQAQSHQVSSDQKTYIFYLRNTFWSDGSPVTAYDFEKTWKNILTPGFPALDAHALDYIKNAIKAKKGEVSLDQVGIRAKDAQTLIVELEYPAPHFLQITASNILFPINQAQEQLFPDWHLEASDHCVFNGPFKLSEWKHHSHIILEKNPYYRLADRFKFDFIYISMINNGIAALNIHASGLFDIISLHLSPLPFDLYRELVRRNLFHIVKMPGTMVCMFNTRKFPFNNGNIRKAFSYAIDKRFLVDHITLLNEDIALGLLPSFLKNQIEIEALDFQALHDKGKKDNFPWDILSCSLTTV